MKKLIKFFVAILVGIISLLYTNSVQANYQSNNETKVSNLVFSWVIGIRAMESSGNVMGLEETYDTNTLKATTDPNNIDVHMVKNTEWGAMALLSASQDYGKKGEGTARYVYGDGTNNVNKQTTTGNAYGIYITASANYVAAGGENVRDNISYLDSMYINRYTGTQTLSGDALLYWHNKKTASYLMNDTAIYFRGSQGIFSFDSFSNTYNNIARNPLPARAAVVNGQGF